MSQVFKDFIHLNLGHVLTIGTLLVSLVFSWAKMEQSGALIQQEVSNQAVINRTAIDSLRAERRLEESNLQLQLRTQEVRIQAIEVERIEHRAVLARLAVLETQLKAVDENVRDIQRKL